MSSKIIKYFGGKGGVFVNKLLPYLPSRSIYIEPFGGSATILLAQKTNIEIYNDVFQNVYSLFRVLSDKALFYEFRDKLELMYYSEQIRSDMKLSLRNKELSYIDRALAYFYVNRTSFNGVGGFSSNVSVRRGISKSVSDYLSAIEGLEEFHQRLSNVIIRNTDGLQLIQEYDCKDSFFYLDPPYHHSTRTVARYECDMSNEQHESLLKILLTCESKVLLSGYDCAVYDVLVENGWHKEIFEVKTVSGNRKPKTKQETIWYNYPKPQHTLFV